MTGKSQPFDQHIETNDPFGMAKFSPRRNTVKIVACLLIIILLLAGNTIQDALNGSVTDAAIPATALAVAVIMVWILIRASIRTVEGEIWIRRLGMGDLDYRVKPKGNDEIAKALHALEAVRQTCIRAMQMERVQQLSEELQQKNQELENTLGELRRTQDQIVAQKKLAELGELSAGAAHEMRNPLQFIRNFGQLSGDIAKDLDEIIREGTIPDPAETAELTGNLIENMQRIVHHTDRANRIISDMTAASRRGNGTFSKTDLNRLLADQTNLAWQAARAQEPEFVIEIEQDLDEDLEPVNAIPEDLARVFTHLVSNACQAMSEKAKNDQAGYLPKLRIETRQTPDGARIRVRDNGTGIAPEVMARIFNPFVTTKNTEWNTGLGLSLSHDIMREHGGTITAESEYGEYTEMTVTLTNTGDYPATTDGRPATT